MSCEIKKIPAKVGGRSLIGVVDKRPCSWGNYFWFEYPDDETDGGGWRCVNMWAENLEAAVEKFLPDGNVVVAVWDDSYALVVDPRIPKDWLYQKLCFTGYTLPRPDVAREMYNLVGDPDNEYERFVDPKSYYAKRGGVYKEFPDGYASVKYKVKSESRPLNVGWK